MRKLRPITKRPDHAWTVAPDVKIVFMISILEAALPLFQNKDPQNPTEGEGSPSAEGEAS